MPSTPNHESRTHPQAGDADIARIAHLIGDPTRAKVLLTLIDGRALPASRLAAEAGVSASTISEHLTKLCEANLLMYERSGRSRYFRLLDPSVAKALEALAEIAPPEPVRSLRQSTKASALRRARTCYNHLSGRLGVTLMTALLDRGLIESGEDHPTADDQMAAPSRQVTYRLTKAGRHELGDFGLDLIEIERHHPPIRYCMDWSEQRHHLAGPLGNALTSRLFDLGWIRPLPTPRAVALTEAGQAGLHATFEIPSDWDKTAPS
jgi:DNA-binding transcriptional ArsR family regulator